MTFTDQALNLFSQAELTQLSKTVEIHKDISRLDKRLQIDIIRSAILTKHLESTPLLEHFKEVMKIGVKEEVFELDSFEIPHCYGFFAECQCLLHKECGEKLSDNLPDCYGVLYDEIECQSCMVKETCQTKGKELDFEADEIFLFRPVNMMTNLLMALAYFKSLYYKMPERIITHPFNRSFNLKKITRIQNKHKRYLPIDCFLMSGTKGEKPTQRQPIIFNQERIPVYEILRD